MLGPLGVTLSGNPEVRVSDVEQDSRRATDGALFVARSGAVADGVRFAVDAVARGAVAVMAAQEAELPQLGCPVLRVRNVPLALGLAAEAVHGRPSQRLRLAGITGTNGKTTVSWLVQHVIEVLGGSPVRVGTLGFEHAGRERAAGLTTPGGDALSRWLAEAVEQGASHGVMEVSSIALVGRRVDALDFDVAGFTNLTRDHLDFHGTLEAYGEAKARLFTELLPATSVLNVDDAFGAELTERCPGRVIAVGRRARAGVSIADLVPSRRGISGRIVVEGRSLPVESPLVGRHNAENLGLAMGMAIGLGLNPEGVAEALGTASQVPGRLERCDAAGDGVAVLVDYAHTPDALGRVLEALRPLTSQRIICVFGCGGDRDASKRQPMGEVASRLSDYAILTNDNPRSESPEAIAAAVELGLRAGGGDYEIRLDRREAIERAVAHAHSGDVVLIAGKGHETYQQTQAGTLPFDDREQARRALAVRRQAQPGAGSTS